MSKPNVSTVEPGKIIVSYQGRSCVMSQVSWSNEDLKAALSNLFHIRPGEHIAALVVDSYGIKVEIGSP